MLKVLLLGVGNKLYIVVILIEVIIEKNLKKDCE